MLLFAARYLFLLFSDITHVHTRTASPDVAKRAKYEIINQNSYTFLRLHDGSKVAFLYATAVTKKALCLGPGLQGSRISSPCSVLQVCAEFKLDLIHG